MELFRRNLGMGLVALFSMFLASACELDSGDDTDAGDAGNGDTPAQCIADGFCDTSCASDPDCETTCTCDRLAGTCDAASMGSNAPCSCDDDCVGESPCVLDGVCDSFCGDDPDCGSCDCDRDSGRCDAADDYTDPDNAGVTAEMCACDPDCVGETDACPTGDGCDPYCGARDGDCSCDCDYFSDVCEADDDHSTDPCSCDDDCGASQPACAADGHCDTFCDPVNAAPPPEYDCKDPDCSERSDGRCQR